MDIYFEKEYADLYEDMEQGTSEIFEYENDKGKGRILFIKRPILEKGSNQVWYDIITPYGYGGPYIECYNEEEKEKFALVFLEKFNEHCIENNIVSSFVRFHPLESNHKFFERDHEVSHISHTIYMDLSSEDLILSNMIGKSRNKLKKSMKYDLEFHEDTEFHYIQKFQEMYYETMQKNSASSQYYFDEEYFRKLIQIKDRVTLFFVKDKEDNILTMSLVMKKEGRLHYHLTANTEMGYKCAANNFLLYNIALWGNRNGYKSLHLGGGQGGDNTPLYDFKKSMNKNGELPFYVGKKIYNFEMYEELVRLSGISEEDLQSKFFPLYRLRK